MTKASPEVEEKARRRLAADEAAHEASRLEEGRITGARRTSQSLGEAWAAFWRHPSPWLVTTFLVGSVAYRATLHSFAWTELLVPAALVGMFPVIEWVIHVMILHWRPRRV